MSQNFIVSWNSCEDCLPPNGERVIVVVEHGRNGNGGPRRVDVARAKTEKRIRAYHPDGCHEEVWSTMFIVGTGSYHPSHPDGFQRKYVSMWAPLPSPPARPVHVGDDLDPAPEPIDARVLSALLRECLDKVERLA